MVVEGRDIGTVIAPDADLKIYLTADAADAARRRYRQNAGGTERWISRRTLRWPRWRRTCDRRDTQVTAAGARPLQAAADAVVIDSSDLGIDETVARVLALAARARDLG